MCVKFRALEGVEKGSIYEAYMGDICDNNYGNVVI